MKRFIIAITGASGACYAKRLFDVLKDRSELHVVISERGVELRREHDPEQRRVGGDVLGEQRRPAAEHVRRRHALDRLQQRVDVVILRPSRWALRRRRRRLGL